MRTVGCIGWFEGEAMQLEQAGVPAGKPACLTAVAGPSIFIPNLPRTVRRGGKHRGLQPRISESATTSGAYHRGVPSWVTFAFVELWVALRLRGALA